jgi:chemotaxis protein MotB
MLDVKSDEMQALIDRLEREKQLLQTEADKVDGLTKQLSRLQNNLAEFENMQSQFKNNNEKEIAALLEQLQKDKEELQKKEEELRERNKKLIDLQAALDKKEQAVKELRKKVADALLGFEGKGLTIEQKDGKVYVSMDEKLLFKSGRYDVEQGGVTALEQLAKVLEQNTDINIMVEGHTDSLAYQGSGNLIDNWDLSVKRATTVVRTLLKGGSTIDPKRVIAAGHSEYAPINTNKTAEGRQQNRRTEIILSPKIDELLKSLESN